MLDQASVLRKLANKKNQRHESISNMRTIAVVSGKGGVGKTNITLNLAISLAQLNKKVLIFDADLGMANVDIMLGLIPQYTLFDVLKGKKKLHEIIVEGPLGIKIVPGGSGLGDITQIDSQHREILWEQLKNNFEDIDYLLIDCGAGVSRTILGFVTAADEVMVVLTPEPTSITDAYSFIKIMSKFNINSEVLLVVNKAASLKEAQLTANKIETVANKFLNIKINKIGYISKDSAVYNSVCKQIPFKLSYPKSQASRDVEQLAKNIIDGVMRPPKGIDSFVGKIFRLFG